MAEGLALQIDGKWAVLSDDVSVDIENSSPVWGEGSSFTLPFELDIEPNRHIIGNSDQITGQSVFDVLDGKPAILYTLGIPVYSGIIKLEDEVEITEGKVDISLVSGNLPFNEMIEGMNCQDVELKDEIIIGERVRLIEVAVHDGVLSDEILYRGKMYAPESFMWMRNDGVNTVNTTKPYPQMPYCNIPICYQMPDEKEDNPIEQKWNGYETIGSDDRLLRIYDKETTGEYVVLGADRSLSAPCFFVLYFLECLFKKIGCSYSDENIKAMEDMCRLAFVSTKCAYDEIDSLLLCDIFKLMMEKGFNISYPSELSKPQYFIDYNIPLIKCKANSKNFPDTDVSSVIEGLENGFGIRFIFNEKENHVSMVFIKDILADPDVIKINVSDIYSVNKVENRIRGFKLTYGGSEDDTAFNYNNWGSLAPVDSYNQIVSQISAYNKVLYLHNKTGNAYRVKVNNQATSSDELDPSLFEVGGFVDATYGDVSKEEFVEDIEMKFTPVTMNDVYTKKQFRVSRGRTIDDTSNNTQKFAFFLDVQMKRPRWIPRTTWSFIESRTNREYDCSFTYFEDQRFDEKIAIAKQSSDRPDKRKSGKQGSFFLRYENDSPIQSFNTGLMLGVMRGGGSDAGVDEFDENYDGEGNSKYVLTSDTPSFHSDTVDNYARVFDYNGSESGGVDNTGRFSLKLRAEKPKPEGGFREITEPYAQKRGLYDKFYTEYAYFVTHRKIVRISCRMEMADILNIDWTKRYHIGQYVGFVNKYNFSVDSRGISNLNLEIYYI